MKKKLLGVAIWRWLLIPMFIILAVGFYTAVPGFSFSGLMCLGIAGIVFGYNLLTALQKKLPKTIKLLRRICTTILCIGCIMVAVVFVIVVHTSLQQPETPCEYVVVLGCKVNPHAPSLSLMERINGAYDYLSANPQSIAILSGGQGVDEPMSEAQCMYEQLIAKGIPAQRLWIEDKSTSTWENLNFSLDLIEEKTGTRPTSIGLVSSEYHVYRATLLAKDCGVTAHGIPAKTSWVALRINNYFRETAGVWHYLILGGQYNA